MSKIIVFCKIHLKFQAKSGMMGIAKNEFYSKFLSKMDTDSCDSKPSKYSILNIENENFKHRSTVIRYFFYSFDIPTVIDL